MELIIGLIAAVAIGCFVFFRKKKEEAVAETAPYKVEPAPVTPEVVAVVEPVVPVTLEVAESAPVAVAEAKSSVKKSRAPKPSVKKAPAKTKTKSK